jgi:hypothetical protein
MHEIARLKIMIEKRKRFIVQAAVKQVEYIAFEDSSSRIKITGQAAAAKQAEYIAFDAKAKSTIAAVAAASKENISHLPDFFKLSQKSNEVAREEKRSITPTTEDCVRFSSADENSSAYQISCNGESPLNSNVSGDFTPDENIDHIGKDKSFSYKTPSLLVEPLVFLIDMNFPIGIPFN